MCTSIKHFFVFNAAWTGEWAIYKLACRAEFATSPPVTANYFAEIGNGGWAQSVTDVTVFDVLRTVSRFTTTWIGITATRATLTDWQRRENELGGAIGHVQRSLMSDEVEGNGAYEERASLARARTVRLVGECLFHFSTFQASRYLGAGLVTSKSSRA